MATVFVTGAAGFVASHVVCRLLADGHVVRGSVRDLERRASYAHLLQLPGAERLELVQANLLDKHVFDRHVVDCEYVFHTASPYLLDVADPKRDLVEPAVQGTRNILEACLAAPAVKRIVLTSSMAAITDEPDDAKILTERDWNERSSLTRNPYYYSKTLAEREAWTLVEKHTPAWDLVVVNPFLVIGPSLNAAINTSNQLFVDLLGGTYPGIMSLTWGFVDVRDVAEAHARAAMVQTASGRYICASETITMRSVVELLREMGFAEQRLPKLGLDCSIGDYAAKLGAYFQPKGVRSYLLTHLGRIPRFDNTKIQRELGLQFRPVATSIRETVENLVRWGHVPTPGAGA